MFCVVVITCALVGAAAESADSLSLLQTRVERDVDVDDKPHIHKGNVNLRGIARGRGAESGIVRLLDFTKATLVHNNLGGYGPVTTKPNGQPAPAEMRFRNLVRGQDIDLVITAGEGYKPFNAERNGILGGNGQINAKSGDTVPLTFTFVDQGTNNPHPLPKFYMTFSDIDERHGGTEKEMITVGGYDRYYTNDDLKIVEGTEDTTPTFQSSDFGDFEDNEISPDSPAPTALSHAVTYLFTEKATFSATYQVDAPSKVHKGRNILFSGISQLVFCQDPSTYLDFTNSTVVFNNLGGKGPDLGSPHEIRYENIGNFNGHNLDLVVTADEQYGYPISNSSQNGLHGDFGHVNLFCGPTQQASEAYLTFSLVQQYTYNPVVVNAFAFVVFDFDSGLHEQQVEYIDINPVQAGFEGGAGYASYIVTDTTELAVSDDANGKKRFMATKHGTEADNPSTSQMLAREVSDKSVVLTFRQASSFKMTIGITATGYDSGRNFMFSGQDMYLMCD